MGADNRRLTWSAIGRWIARRAGGIAQCLRHLVRDDRDAAIIRVFNEAAILMGAAGAVIAAL